jgi:putative hemolysin
MSTTAVLVEDCGKIRTETPLFQLSMALDMADVVECQRLRCLVFNCELGEGLSSSAQAGLDRDEFDLICDHLMVRDASKGLLIGTYRLQTGYRAQGNLGYYSQQLFDLKPLEPIRGQVLELGRACVHPDYRNTGALQMLWKGIAQYALLCGARYLIGCSSLTSQDESEGAALYEFLRDRFLAPTEFQTSPHSHCRCGGNGIAGSLPKIPRLFRAYLDVSAKLCGPPAIDREFRTIDFLTFVDLEIIPGRVRNRFFQIYSSVGFQR